MQTMKNILLILLAAAGLCSCERFLTNGDPNKIDAPTYFRNESDLEAYANGFLQTMIPTAISVAHGRRPCRLYGLARRVAVPDRQFRRRRPVGLVDGQLGRPA